MFKHELATTVANFFSIFKLLAMVIYKTKTGIVHMQCLLRVDGSILASVLTSCLCVVPESSDFSDVSSSLFVHVEFATPTALVAPSQRCTASFKDFLTIGGSHRHWQLFSSIDLYAVVSNRFRLQLLTIKVLL